MRAIAAMSLNRAIGLCGGLPWTPMKDDMKWFRKMTTEIGGNVLMGRTTYDGMRLLRNRFSYVLTTNPTKLAYPDCTSSMEYVTLDQVLSDKFPSNDTWVIGGAKTYKLLLPHCNEVYLTLVLDEYEGDTYMPEFESQFPNMETIKEAKNYWIIKYWK